MTLGTPHAYLPVTTSPIIDATISQAKELFSIQQPYSPKPLPVILSISSAATYTRSSANSFLDGWLDLIASFGQNVPVLWLGPLAASFNLPEDRILVEGNDVRWRYSLEMENHTRFRSVESLGMWNLTVQAENSGLELALVQAMMVRLLCAQ